MITAAADGSSLSNPGPAGWAWFIDHDRWAAGGWLHGTNNMGELMAVLDLLRQTSGSDESLLVLCDSQYVINSLTKWLPGWKRRGWKRADGKPVLNRDLLSQLDAELAGRDVRFDWVKGHAGHELNEHADTLARAAATSYRDGTPVRSGPGFGVEPARRPVPAVVDVPEPATLFDEPVEQAGVDAEDPPPAAPNPADPLELERRLLDPGLRTDPAAYRRLLHPDFEEVGRSGRQYHRGDIPAAGPAPDVRMDNPRADVLDDGVVLVRYRAVTGEGSSWRSSVWQRTPAGWRLRYHQATDAE